jgi:predicted adenylyl cyclase CyaB
MADLEIETKIKLDKGEIPKLRKKIKNLARFKKKSRKYDTYFAIKTKGYPKNAFRIRKEKNKYVVNFKKWLKNYWTKDIVVKEEFEFEIKSIKTFLALMKDLWFVEWIKKFKLSETYTYKKNSKVNIEINKVEHLGYFMEIEYIAKKTEIKKAINTIKIILNELEIDSKKIDNTGYTKMLWDKR